MPSRPSTGDRRFLPSTAIAGESPLGCRSTRRRASSASIDVPVTFDSISAAADSTTVPTLGADSVKGTTPVLDSAPPKPTGYTVSFFALLSEQRAQTEAARIRVGGEVAHVETVMRNG